MSTRWASWRRDLLFALAGVLFASAVLVPVGWLRICAERSRAEAAEAEAARNQAIAEDRTRTTHQEDEHTAEREKAQRDLNEEYRLLLEQFTQNDLKDDRNLGPRELELQSERERARELERKQVEELLRKYRQK